MSSRDGDRDFRWSSTLQKSWLIAQKRVRTPFEPSFDGGRFTLSAQSISRSRHPWTRRQTSLITVLRGRKLHPFLFSPKIDDFDIIGKVAIKRRPIASDNSTCLITTTYRPQEIASSPRRSSTLAYTRSIREFGQ